ncbi:hypothetical protein PIB30_108660, partial [Stylosanthes scabra]|nr:hypothetical protein [Stylosanthes scabra]
MLLPSFRVACYRFFPKHNNCTTEITSVIKLMYDEAWPTWKAIPAATRARMFDKWATKSLDRPVSMAEVFKQTHTLKANKEQFADKRSSDIWDEFTSNTTVATQQAVESGTNAEVDPDQVWRQTVSEPSQKNRVFGIGGFLASTLRTSVFAPQASSVSLTSPAPAGPEEAVDLREQVQLLNQNIQDMARQLHESEERIQALHDELSS